tara:strand:- start:517 stop:687 length:171 start_codon:yes stop_codon:yes gene_type:complete
MKLQSSQVKDNEFAGSLTGKVNKQPAPQPKLASIMFLCISPGNSRIAQSIDTHFAR